MTSEPSPLSRDAGRELPSAVGAPDEQVLGALPTPPRRARTITVIVMVLTALAAGWMALSLRGEAGYALTPSAPLEVGDLALLRPGPDLQDRYVRASGLLAAAGAIRYGRVAESDSFRLAPVAGNPTIWVETRVPEGFEGPRFVPPTTFAGRLVPIAAAGLRHDALAATVHAHTRAVVPANAWLLVDGSSPRASRWAVALIALFLGFAAWNVFGVVRLLGRIKDEPASDDGRDGAVEDATA